MRHHFRNFHVVFFLFVFRLRDVWLKCGKIKKIYYGNHLGGFFHFEFLIFQTRKVWEWITRCRNEKNEFSNGWLIDTWRIASYCFHPLRRITIKPTFQKIIGNYTRFLLNFFEWAEMTWMNILSCKELFASALLRKFCFELNWVKISTEKEENVKWCLVKKL